MEKLSSQQITRLRHHLIQNGSDESLLSELVDHMACEVEYYMWIGLPFETAIDKAMLEASSDAVGTLQETYRDALTLKQENMAQASLDDIVFETRNKAYGAYYLRQNYGNSLRDALLGGAGFFLMLIGLISGLNQGKWSYMTLSGAMWLVGISCVAFSGFSWFIQNMKQKYMVVND
nr:hypothetical protein [uncultured Arsenicibacter sp.]